MHNMKQLLFSYVTIAFAPVIFLAVQMTGMAIHIAWYFFMAVLSVDLLENVVIFSSMPTGFFDIHGAHIEYSWL